MELINCIIIMNFDTIANGIGNFVSNNGGWLAVIAGILAIFAFIKGIIQLLHKRQSKTKDDKNKINDSIESKLSNTFALAKESILRGLYLPQKVSESQDNKQKAKKVFLLNEYFDDVFSGRIKGQKFFCIMADAGMGKTCALANILINYLRHSKNSCDIRIEYLPDFIKNLENQDDINSSKPCILLLDAVDECKDAAKEPEVFMQKLAGLTQKYKFVIATARTQFFTDANSEPKKTNVRYGDDFYRFKKLYLLPFDKKQIESYIEKLTKTNDSLKKKKDKVRQIMTNCHELLSRPLILSYLPDLVDSENKMTLTAQAYDVIVQKWLQREVIKVFPQFDKEEQKEEKIQQLREICLHIAKYMYLNGIDIITNEELLKIAVDNHEIVDKLGVDNDTLRCNSLLTREGDLLKFSHRSFYEYLMAYNFFTDRCEVGENPNLIVGMDFTDKIFDEIYKIYQDSELNSLYTDEIRSISIINISCTLNNMALLHYYNNNIRAAEKEYEEALKIRRELAESNHAKFDEYVATTLYNMAILHYDKGEKEEAMKKANEALKLYRELALKAPDKFKLQVERVLKIRELIFQALIEDNDAV